MSRRADDRQPLRFLRRQDRAIHHSGSGRIAARGYQTLIGHRGVRPGARRASHRVTGSKAHPCMARSTCGPAAAGTI
jgi:hypothetical protein